MRPLQYYWYESSLSATLVTGVLLPLSWLYCLITAIRRKLYQLKIKKSLACDVPVVVVGNIVVGGSGKTPLLIELCEYVRACGFNPGVVSRGYGGSIHDGVQQVTKEHNAKQVGDEPLMIFEQVHVPVVVGADRVSAINSLLENNHCDIVFSDDGLQHYRMQRDLEIAVIDASRQFGNGLCLPAGPLRERVTRLKEVDLVVYNAATASTACSYALQLTGFKQLHGDELRSVNDFTDGVVIHAVAGIGYPARFFKQLTNSGIEIIEHAFPDHHSYAASDFSDWQDECIIMTEKDAVKCRKFDLTNAWVSCVKAVMTKQLRSQLDSKLLPLLNG